MENDIVLVKLETARLALREADIYQTKTILDMAVAAETYAKRQKLSDESIQYATSIKIEALQQLGNMLKSTPRNTGTRLIGGTNWEPPDETPTLAELGLDKKTSKLAQDVAKLSPEKIESVKRGIISLSQANKNIHVSNNSGENEWYTPPEIIEAARMVLGSIELDPASSEIANGTVKATTFYDINTNGLDRDWIGKTWMNPPYSSELIKKFIENYVKNVCCGNIPEGIVLVNNATETNWFNELVSVSTGIVFPNSRIKFIDMNGNPSGAPLQGQAIVYAGNKINIFFEVFNKFGWCAKL